jgi:hypothetical protein
VAVWAEWGKVVEVIVRGVFIDMVELNEGRLADATSVVRFAQNIAFQILRYWRSCFQWRPSDVWRFSSDALSLF